jgi:hypothetical protein
MRFTLVAVAAAMFSIASVAYAAESTDTDATPPPKTVTCKDGTSSPAGQGACSHHGGVKPATTHTTHSTSTSSGTTHASNASTTHTASSTSAKGATAKCKDGTYSHAKTQSGACSKHGGVDTWLNGSGSNGAG